MTDIDPEAIAEQARFDQYRAHATEFLDRHIAEYKKLVDERGEDIAFPASVSTTLQFVDPDDELETEQSNRLTFAAEVLAVAISRLVGSGR